MNNRLKRAALGFALAIAASQQVSAIDLTTPNLPSIGDITSTSSCDMAVKGMLALAVGSGIYSALKTCLNTITQQDEANDIITGATENVNGVVTYSYGPKSQPVQSTWLTKAKKAAAVVVAFCLGAAVVNSSAANLIFNGIYNDVEACFEVDLRQLKAPFDFEKPSVVINPDGTITKLPAGLNDIINNGVKATKVTKWTGNI